MIQEPAVSVTGKVNHERYGQGCAYLEAEEYANAISAFKQAIQIWPEDSAAWLALGQCYEQSNKPRRAEASFRQAVEFATEENQLAALTGLKNSLHMQNREQEAAELVARIEA